MTVLFPLTLVLAGCERDVEGVEILAEASDPTPTGTESADLEELLRAAEPADPTATSDVKDAQLADYRAVLARLKSKGGRALGRAALAAFDDESSGHTAAVRLALLEVAAWCDPAHAAPRLEQMIVEYDSALGLFLRTEAVRLLAETSPERALELLGALVVDERPNATRPSQAALMDGWVLAAKRLGHRESGVPAQVAISLFQPADARYSAIVILGEFGGTLAVKTLEEILTEAASDGMVRRKAAQGLVRCSTPEELCPLLEEVAAHESDPAFLYFLDDMIVRNCAE